MDWAVSPALSDGFGGIGGSWQGLVVDGVHFPSGDDAAGGGVACEVPVPFRGTSLCPRKRSARFQAVCPWRTRMIRVMATFLSAFAVPRPAADPDGMCHLAPGL